MADWVGYRWLGERFGIVPVQHLRVTSQIGSTRSTVDRDGTVSQTYPSAWRQPETLAGQPVSVIRREDHGSHHQSLRTPTWISITKHNNW